MVLVSFLLTVNVKFDVKEINWDDVGDLTEKEISLEDQNKLLSDYERELIQKKMKNKTSSVEDSIGEELAQMDLEKKQKKKKAVSPDIGT